MDKDWPSTEHFFQAQKFVGTPIEDKIRKCGSAREALELARKPQYQAWLHPEWHKGVKDDVMMLAVKEKFTQHEDLQKKLLQTGEREIVEHTANDSYWGDGGGWGRGQNKLGKILMQVRNELKEGIQSDPQRVRCLPHRSSLTERGMERVGSHSRPRSRSVDRIQQGGTDYGYGHSSRRDGQPTSGVEGLGRRPLSRRDGSTTGVGGTGRGHSSRDGQPISRVGDLERRHLNRRGGPTTGVGGTGRGLSSRQDGPVQPTTGAVHTGMGALSRGGQAIWDSTPQTSRPASSSKRCTGRGNESSRMAALLTHTPYSSHRH